MSTPALLFSVYLLVGLILMIVAVAAPGKEKRTKGFMPFGGGDPVETGLFIAIVLLWPVWLLVLISKKEPKK